MTGRTEVPSEFRQTEEGATERQVEFIRDLMLKRVMTDDQRAKAASMLEEGLTKKQASAWIDKLQTLPHSRSKFEQRKESVPEVSAGKYALGSDDDPDDPIKFYKVQIGAKDNERWAGFVFLSVLAGPEEHPIKAFDTKVSILKRIAEDPGAAARLYGLKTKRCGVCGRRLTRKESRERGIGPVCAAERGW